MRMQMALQQQQQTNPMQMLAMLSQMDNQGTHTQLARQQQQLSMQDLAQRSAESQQRIAASQRVGPQQDRMFQLQQDELNQRQNQFGSSQEQQLLLALAQMAMQQQARQAEQPLNQARLADTQASTQSKLSEVEFNKRLLERMQGAQQGPQLPAWAQDPRVLKQQQK